jgi:hypothetical protein
MRTLLRYPILATSVRELLLDKIIWNGRDRPAEMPWWRDGQRLLKNLPNLKYLTIDISWSFLFLSNPYMPELTCATIRDCGKATPSLDDVWQNLHAQPYQEMVLEK